MADDDMLALKLLACRKTLLFLHGERYDELAAPWREAITRAMSHDPPRTVLQVVLSMAVTTDPSISNIWLFAAAVDVIQDGG